MDTKDLGKLAPCPCGEIPTELSLTQSDIRRALVTWNCCGEWSIECRLYGFSTTSEDGARLAREAWNNAPRDKRC